MEGECGSVKISKGAAGLGKSRGFGAGLSHGCKAGDTLKHGNSLHAQGRMLKANIRFLKFYKE